MSRAFEVEVRPSLTPEGAGTLADAAFEVFRLAAAPLLVLSAATNVPLFAALAGLVLFIRDRGWAWGTPGYFGTLAALSLAAAAAAWLRAIGTAAMAHAAGEAASGRPAGAIASLGAALRAPALIPLVCALRVGAAVIGLLACFLPGLTVLGALAMAPHAAIFEGRGTLSALGRSLRLATVGATGLAAAGMLVLAVYVIGAVQILLAVRMTEVLATLAVPSLPGGWLGRPETPWLLAGAAKVLADPFVSAASTAVFLDSRIRADGMDLELRVEALGGGTPALLPPREAIA